MVRTHMTRREFGAGILGSSYAAAQSGHGTQSGIAIDQNPIRRRGVGLRGVNAARASAGMTLFAPMNSGGAVYLIDLNGKLVHTWHMPYPPGLYGYLTERGTLFYNAKIPNETFLGKAPFMGGAVLEVDWNGRILWEVRNPNHHQMNNVFRSYRYTHEEVARAQRAI
jgi:hypothetical protein